MSGFLDYAIEPKYEDILNFSEGFAAVKLGDKWGFIDKKGKAICKFQYDDVNPFSGGLAAVCLKYAWGFIDTSGKTVIEPKYSKVHNFNSGFALVFTANPKGPGLKGLLVDPKGAETVLDDDFNAYGASENLVVAGRNSRKNTCYLDKKGKVALEIDYEFAGEFHEGLAYAKVKGKFGYIDLKGNLVIPAVYLTADDFSGGFAKVKLGTYLYTFIDKKGVPINQKGWPYLGPRFDDGLCWFKDVDGASSGFINMKGEEALLYRFNSYADSCFSEGLAPVEHSRGKWGFIDKKGNSVGEKTLLDNAREFREGLAAVCESGEWGFVKNPLK